MTKNKIPMKSPSILQHHKINNNNKIPEGTSQCTIMCIIALAKQTEYMIIWTTQQKDTNIIE